MSYKIYLSPSMQKNNAYAYGNTNEMEECNKIAEEAKKALESCGFEVKKAVKGQSMAESIKESNCWNADLHIPIHTNAANGSCDGTLVMVYSNSEKNLTPANAIYDSVFEVTPGKTHRAIQSRPDLAELCQTKATAVYIECEFHDNPEIAKWIINNTSILGQAIAKGVCDYFKIPFPEKQNNKTTENKIYRVQIGAFANKTNAENTLKNAKNAGFTDSYIKEELL